MSIINRGGEHLCYCLCYAAKKETLGAYLRGVSSLTEGVVLLVGLRNFAIVLPSMNDMPITQTQVLHCKIGFDL